MIRVPKLNPPAVARPRRLTEWLRKQQVVFDQGFEPVDRNLLMEARQLVRDEMERPGMYVPSRRLVPSLLEMLSDEQPNPQIISDLVLRVRGVSWRHLWTLWQVYGNRDDSISNALIHLIGGRARASKSFVSRLPAWLPADNPARLRSVLERPVAHLRSWLPEQKVPLEDVSSSVQLMAGSWVLGELLPMLIIGGPDNWWRLSSSAALRAWAENTPSCLPYVCDRLLVENVPKGPVDRTLEGSLLLNWTLQRMGDPYLRPGQWQAVSDPGKAAFERLHLANVLNEILVQFQKNANDDRAEFWANWFGSVTDARFYKARESAVCMIALKGKLFVEFGDTGNACYAYRPQSALPPLRTLKIPRSQSVSHFKSKYSLTLDGQELRYIKSMNHRGEWQERFNDYFVMGD